MNTFFKTLFIIIVVQTVGAAQDFQGTATYMSKSTVDMNFGGRQMPEAQKKMIQERMKSMLEKTFVLNFDRTRSTYQEEQKLNQPGTGGGGGMRFMGLGGGSGAYYKDIQAQTYTNETDIFGKPFLVEDTLKPLAWTMTAETKQIGQYTCYKATAVKQLDTTMRSMFGRMRPGQRGNSTAENEKELTTEKDSAKTNKEGENSLASRIEMPSEVIVTAWYTLEIPISQGPGEYWGLPGLILEVSEGRTAILCSKITINPKEKIAIEAPKKGKKISQKEYQETMTKKALEMSEQFRGRDGSGGTRIMIRN
ncbi:MAG: GLPGLI family protein [Bacteroidetes bacterium]|nr:GLPGLI family protein [Bacteroidota bacterium]